MSALKKITCPNIALFTQGGRLNEYELRKTVNWLLEKASIGSTLTAAFQQQTRF